MSNREELENAVTTFYEARNRADLDGAMSLMDPGCSFRIVGTDQLGPFTQTAGNRDEIREIARSLFDVWDLSGLRNVSVHVDGDTAFVHRVGTIRFIPTETTFQTEIMDRIRFRDGLMIDFQQFIDTYLVAKIAGLG